MSLTFATSTRCEHIFTGQGQLILIELAQGMSRGAMVGPGCVEGGTNTQIIWFLGSLRILGDGQGHWGDLDHSV